MHVTIAPAGSANSMLWYVRGLKLQAPMEIPCKGGQQLSYFLGDPVSKGNLQGQGVSIQAPSGIAAGTICKLVVTGSEGTGPTYEATLRVTVTNS